MGGRFTVILQASFLVSATTVAISALLPWAHCENTGVNVSDCWLAVASRRIPQIHVVPVVHWRHFYKFSNAAMIILLLASQLTSTVHIVPCQILFCQMAESSVVLFSNCWFDFWQDLIALKCAFSIHFPQYLINRRKRLK